MQRLQEVIDEGWSVQVYGRDRRLLFSMHPSHGWTFLAGLIVGFSIATAAASGDRPASPPASTFSSPMEPLLRVD